MKVIKLTESDIERLVKKIIKEDEFDWVQDISADTPYRREITNFYDMMDCCSKHVKWDIAYSNGEKYFNRYLNRNDPYEVYFDKDDIPKFIRVGGEYYVSDDHSVRPQDINIDGYSIGEIPQRIY